MRFITIASVLVATAYVAVAAPVHSIARRAQDGVGAVILMPHSNGVVQRDDNYVQDLLVRELFARDLFSNWPYGLFPRSSSDETPLLDEHGGPTLPTSPPRTPLDDTFEEVPQEEKPLPALPPALEAQPTTAHASTSSPPNTQKPNTQKPKATSILSKMGIGRKGNPQKAEKPEKPKKQKKQKTQKKQKEGTPPIDWDAVNTAF